MDTTVRGNYLIVTTHATNNSDVTIDENLKIYIKDSIGIKHFVDSIYIELGPNQKGISESSIGIDKLGPPPYTVETEWN